MTIKAITIEKLDFESHWILSSQSLLVYLFNLKMLKTLFKHTQKNPLLRRFGIILLLMDLLLLFLDYWSWALITSNNFVNMKINDHKIRKRKTSKEEMLQMVYLLIIFVIFSLIFVSLLGLKIRNIKNWLLFDFGLNIQFYWCNLVLGVSPVETQIMLEKLITK